MGTRDPRVDAYIRKRAAFARSILEHLRELVHRACPEVVETIKWSMPAFEHHGPLANMAGFKAHCTFGFWKGRLVFESGKEGQAMGQLGRITSPDDLPADRQLVAWVRKAAKLNESGVKQPTPRKRAKPKIALPDELADAFGKRKNAAAKRFFDGLSPSHRREYLEWIVEARRPETRARRVATTLEWLAEGKRRNWKYERK